MYGRHVNAAEGRACQPRHIEVIEVFGPRDEDRVIAGGETIVVQYAPSSCPPCAGRGYHGGMVCAACMGTGTTVVGNLPRG